MDQTIQYKLEEHPKTPKN